MVTSISQTMLLATLVLLLSIASWGSCYDYAVQPEAVRFTDIPLSQTVIEGERIQLTCNISITKLGSNYPVPHLRWRLNGMVIGNLVKPDNDDIRMGHLYSELVIDSASVDDGGYYECIAIDGKTKANKFGEGAHIMSSPRAHVRVISLDDFQTQSAGSGSVLEPYGIEAVILKYGEPYSIPCELGVVGISSHILWYRNGTLVNRNTRLANGSLLLPAATEEDTGLYYCSLQIRDTTINSSTLEIQVTQEPYEGGPHIYFDTPLTLPLMPGISHTLRCYILGAPPTTMPTATSLEVEVLKDGQKRLAGSPSAESPFKQVYVSEAGQYACRLTSGDAVLSTKTVTVVPGYVATAEDVSVFVGGNNKMLSCEVQGGKPYQSVHWYKNGDTLAVSEDSYELVGNSPELDGSVYQCFVVTATGVVHQTTWRVFDFRFTNPPTNVRCRVAFQDFEAQLYHPRVTVTWDVPDFVALTGATGELQYSVFAQSGLTDEGVITTDGFLAEFELDGLNDIETTEGVYGMVVKNNVDGGEYDSAPARCDFSTISRAINRPLPLSAECSSAMAVFTWRNELARRVFDVGVSQLLIQVVCLYGNHTPYHFDLTYNDGDECEFSYYDGCEITSDQLSYDLELTTTTPNHAQQSQNDEEKLIPVGAVCHATGQYVFDHGNIDVKTTPPVAMPPVSCITRPTQLAGLLPQAEEEGEREVYLELLCSEGALNMTWFTSSALSPSMTNLSLYTSCLNSFDSQPHIVFSSKGAELAGSESVEEEGLILCSFYGQFTDSVSGDTVYLTPVHCYAGQPMPIVVKDALPLAANCSSSSADFFWNNIRSVQMSLLHIQVLCFYRRPKPYQFEISYNKEEGYNQYQLEGDQPRYGLVVDTTDPLFAKQNSRNDNRVIPSGAVCHATGHYLFAPNSNLVFSDRDDNEEVFIMPPVSCVTQDSQLAVLLPTEGEEDENVTVALGLVCSEQVVNVSWATSTHSAHIVTDLTLHTLCLNSSGDIQLHEVFSSEGAELAGSESVEEEGLILCSFYGQFTDSVSGDTVYLPPVHCYADQPRPTRSLTLLPTATLSVAVPQTTVLSSPASSSMQYTIILEVSIPSSVVIVVAIVLIIVLIVILKYRSYAKHAGKLQFTVEWEELDKNYQPFNPSIMGTKTMSIETVYEDCAGAGCEQVFKLDTGTPSDSDNSEGLKDGGTPSLSPIILEVATETEDSGCGLQFEVSSDRSHGKEHLFTRFLSEIEQGSEHKGLTTASENVGFELKTRFDMRESDERDYPFTAVESEAASQSIAQMVADRLHGHSDSAVPSSGYGTIDCYKLSTEASAVSPEYLAQKLRDVEESDLDRDGPLNPSKAPPTNKGVLKLDLAIGVVSGDRDGAHLPCLLLTPPQLDSCQADMRPQLGVTSVTTSASTGDLSSSYYQDNEGYLHVSSETNSGRTQSTHIHHQSFDNILTKSL